MQWNPKNYQSTYISLLITGIVVEQTKGGQILDFPLQHNQELSWNHSANSQFSFQQIVQNSHSFYVQQHILLQTLEKDDNTKHISTKIVLVHLADTNDKLICSDNLPFITLEDMFQMPSKKKRLHVPQRHNS